MTGLKEVLSVCSTEKFQSHKKTVNIVVRFENEKKKIGRREIAGAIKSGKKIIKEAKRRINNELCMARMARALHSIIISCLPNVCSLPHSCRVTF